MTPPTGGGAASWARAGGASELAMTKIVMTMSVPMRPDRDMSGKLSCFLPTTLAFPEDRGESVRATRTSAATCESGRRQDQAPSFSRCGRHPRCAASGTKTAQSICFRAIAARSRRWSPACHPDPSPQSQERKRKAERRQTRSPRPVRKRRTGRATEKAACAALPLRARSPAGVPLTALAAATERHRSAPVHALPGTELGRDGCYPSPAVPVQRAL